MDILYISCYPNNYFRRVVNESKNLSSHPSQKFNKMLVDGFKQNSVNISVLSTFNHLKWDTDKFWITDELIIEDGIKYKFLSSVKMKYLNHIYMHLAVRKFLNNWKQKTPNGVIVIDFLKPFSNLICKYAKGNSIITIVTDLPEFLMENSNGLNKLKNKIKLNSYNEIIQKSTHYVFLTEQMNIRLNNYKKPYCIVEGLVDINMAEDNKSVQKYERKVCLYSGALCRQFGIDNLVKAFMSERLSKYELHLYGTGDYTSEIKKIVKEYNNIKYFGNVENVIVVQKQIQATVLINPRPTDEEYTKYSFPSKNMEYMVSGTPVITTNLAGMPNEYKKYVYILDGYSEDDIINCIDEVLSKPSVELKQKGQSARNFVLKNKNNIIQTKKILDMIYK